MPNRPADSHIEVKGGTISTGCNGLGLLLACLVFLNSVLVCAASAQTPPDLKREKYRKAWLAIRSLSPDKTKYPLGYADYWFELSCRAYFDHFEPLARSKDGDMWLEYFAKQFGKHGGDADLRWLLVCQDYTIPGRWPRDSFRDGDPHSIVANKLCEQIVKNCLSDKKYFQRYGEAVLWSQMCLRETSTGFDFRTLVDTLRTTLPKCIDDPNYWWWARRFLIAVYVTSSQDLLKNTSPDELHGKFKEWLRRYEAIAFQLAADETSPCWIRRPQGVFLDLLRAIMCPEYLPELNLPKKPFPDIQGPYPTGDLFRWLPSPLDPNVDPTFLPENSRQDDGHHKTTAKQQLLNGKRKKDADATASRDLSNEPPGKYRTWTDISGQRLTVAEFLGADNSNAALKRPNGTTVIVPRKNLSLSDQRFIKHTIESLKPLKLGKLLTNSVGMKLILLPSGDFVMGSSDPFFQQPLHKVRITKRFYMGVTEVTQEQYEKVMGDNPSGFCRNGEKPDRVAGLDTSRFPVENVSWNDAVEFCKRLSELPVEKAAGRAYRLPTEAEWEYACRAGTLTRYHFGDDAARLGEYAWFFRNAKDGTSPIGRAHPVAEKRPNAWGLYDMCGNVWEWCSDWRKEDYYMESPVDDPKGPSSGKGRVWRGGCYGSFAGDCRSACRGGGVPSYRYSNVGFRVVVQKR